MDKYSAKINHSEDTIRAMCRARVESFRSKAYYITYFACVAMLAAALLWKGLPQTLQLLFIAVGCVTFVAIQSSHKRLAEDVIKNMKGSYPKISYNFSPGYVQISGADAGAELKYKDVLLLLEDSSYLYIFLKDRSAYMLERSSVKPDVERFKAFISRKTGLRWTRRRSPINRRLNEALRFERVKTRL